MSTPSTDVPDTTPPDGGWNADINQPYKMTLRNFIDELKERGFDGFTDIQLTKYINRGYFAVAKKSRWEWERQTVTFTVNAGVPFVDIPCTTQSWLPYFRSLERIYKTTTGHSGKMEIFQEQDFYENWLGQDYSQQNLWNEPSRYFIYDEKLYLLSPCAQQRTYVATYILRPVPLASDLDQPITPFHLDEAIVDAARVRAHTRANEPGLAVSARSDLEEALDDIRDDEEEDMHEMQERTSPDNTWA